MLIIRDFIPTDKDHFIEMCKDFYSGGAVLHAVDPKCFETTFDAIIGKTPFARGLLLEQDGETAGYLLLSFTYSNEVGGLVVLLEELYVLPKFQGMGIGKQMFDFVFAEYDSTAKRYRLEVNTENTRAIKLYKNLAFEKLHYDQYMIER